MTSKPRVSWRAGLMTFFWAFVLCVCLYIWHYLYLFARWAICG